jgi:hypothetical protein
MAVSGYLFDMGDETAGSENEVFFHSVKPAIQGGAIAFFRQPAETVFFTGPDQPADIDGMGVNNEKGEACSPRIVQ